MSIIIKLSNVVSLCHINHNGLFIAHMRGREVDSEAGGSWLMSMSPMTHSIVNRQSGAMFLMVFFETKC
jgi:hypothetical protein